MDNAVQGPMTWIGQTNSTIQHCVQARKDSLRESVCLLNQFALLKRQAWNTMRPKKKNVVAAFWNAMSVLTG